MPTGLPALDDVRSWLGLAEDDHLDDGVLQTSLDAAITAQARMVVYPTDDFAEEYVSDDLWEALMLRTQRLAARRNSPEGVVGLAGVGGDFVSARVPSFDADIDRCEGPYRVIAVS